MPQLAKRRVRLGARGARRLLLVAIAGAWLSAPASATVPGPRDPLTFKNSGLYGGFPNSYFVSSSTPFDFFTVQAVPYQNQSSGTWASSLQSARASGKRIIADLNPQALNSNGQYFGISDLTASSTDADLNKLVAVIDQFFSQVNVNDVYAITLGEENIFWNGRSDQLNALYNKIKAKYNVPIYQWYSPSGAGSIPGISGWPNLKADGWMADEYFLDQPNMERAMRAFTIQRKPAIQTVWAGGTSTTLSPFYPQRFASQVQVLQKYDIPASYFVWSGVGGYNGYDPGAPADSVARFQTVLDQVAKSKLTNGPDRSTWDQVAWEIPKIGLGFTSLTDTIPSYSENYTSDRVVRFVNDAQISNFANLHWDSSPVELRPRQAGASQASVTYSFQSAFPVSQLRLNAGAFATAGKGGAVTFSLLDPSGNVIQQTSSINAQGVMTLTVPGTRLLGRDFKVSYGLSGTATQPGDLLAGVSSLDVQADIVTPRQKAIPLQASDANAVSYGQNLASMNIFQTAQFNNPSKLSYSTDGLYANTTAGSLEVIQPFSSPRDMTVAHLHINGSADQAGNSAQVGVGVSLDGTNVLASTMSTGAFSGDLTLDLMGLVNKIKAKQFYVHLFLQGNYGLITSFAVDGTVAPLGVKNDFGTTSQTNSLLWFNNASPATVSTTPPASVQLTATAHDYPSGSTFSASDLDSDGLARNLYMTGGASPSTVSAVRPFSADPFKVFDSVSVSGVASSAQPDSLANATGVILSHARTTTELSSFATSSQMQPVSVSGGASFSGTSRFWAGARISNANATAGPDGFYASRFTGLQVTTAQRDPRQGERVLLTNNDLGTTAQQQAWTITGSATPQFYANNIGDVSNDLLACGIRFAGSTNLARQGTLSLVFEVDAPAGKFFDNLSATADSWALAGWGSSAQLLLSRDGTNFDLAGNVASNGATSLSVSSAGIAGYEALSSVWLKVSMSDAWGYSISSNYLRVENLLFTGEMGTTPGTQLRGQWNVPASGDWNQAANWSGDVPNAIDAVAQFLGEVTSAQTVYTNLPVTVGTLRFDNANTYVLTGAGSLTLQTSSGSAVVSVLQGSHAINLPLFVAGDTTLNVAPGATLTIADPITIRANRTVTKSGNLLIQAPLTIEPGGALVLAGGTTRLFGIPSLGAGARIDVKNNSLTIDYRGQASPASAIAAQLLSGYAAGAWNGSGINTSAAVPGQTGLGWKDDPGSQSLLVKYTWYGDASLDGQVDVTDLGLLATKWQAAATWSGGDFNYDGVVNVTDLGLLATNWQAGVGSPLGPGSLQAALATMGLGQASVPEPASALLLSLGTCVCARRHRSRPGPSARLISRAGKTNG